MRTLSVIFMCLLLAASVTAAPLSRQDVPDALRPWVEWALYGEQQDVCPIVFNDGEQAICAWPSFLTLDVQKSTAAFSQQWRVYSKDIWLILPGGEGLWPQEVTVNGAAHPVGDRDGRPSVRISAPGEYKVSGAFYFNRLPEWFRVPGADSMAGFAALFAGATAVPSGSHGSSSSAGGAGGGASSAD